MTRDLIEITCRPAADLDTVEHAEILALCSQAFETDFTPFLHGLPDPVHVLARRQGHLVSHALWVTRWLQPGGLPLLRTAYIEAVATSPRHTGQGLATRVMERVAQEAIDYDLAALSTGELGFYARFGWELWHGPLYVRRAGALQHTPEDEGSLMILRLPRTPRLDLAAPISVEWREQPEVW